MRFLKEPTRFPAWYVCITETVAMLNCDWGEEDKAQLPKGLSSVRSPGPDLVSSTQEVKRSDSEKSLVTQPAPGQL